jgi:hypothetical protein
LSSATAAGSGATPPWESSSSAGLPGIIRIARKTMLATIQTRPIEIAIRRASQSIIPRYIT